MAEKTAIRLGGFKKVYEIKIVNFKHTHDYYF